jgi:mono/diheme cytochrome c family protein
MRFLILTIASALAAQTAGPAVENSLPAGDAKQGKRLFAAYGCYECHGYEGQGGRAGPRIAPRPIAFRAFSKYIREPSGQMPPYTVKVTSDQDLSDIYAFLQTIVIPPAIKDLLILRND